MHDCIVQVGNKGSGVVNIHCIGRDVEGDIDVHCIGRWMVNGRDVSGTRIVECNEVWVDVSHELLCIQVSGRDRDGWQ